MRLTSLPRWSFCTVLFCFGWPLAVVAHNSLLNCTASDQLLFRLQQRVKSSLKLGQWNVVSNDTPTDLDDPVQHDWPNQVIYMGELLQALANKR